MTGAAHHSRAKSRNASTSKRRWHRGLGWVLAALLFLSIVGVIGWGIGSAWIAAHSSQVEASEFWAAFTGPVGDTLGPVLSTLAILVTVFVAVLWQPKQDRLEYESRQEQSRASRIDGWVAESIDGRHFGIVVSNDADATIFALDLVIMRGENDHGDEVGIHRELRLPRGSWFIEFVPHENRPASWRAPVPVHNAGGMEVTLGPFEDDKARNPRQHVLRPHVPESAGAPYYVLGEMRYLLHDVPWKRDDHGRAVPAGDLAPEENQRRENAGKRARQEQRDRTVSSARVGEELESLVRFVIEVLCRTDQPDIEDLYAESIRQELLVDSYVLPNVASLTRPSTGGQLHLNLRSPQGGLMKLVPSRDVFPKEVFMLRKNSEASFVIAGKNAGGVVKKAGAAVIGEKNAGDITSRTAMQWMRTESEKWKLIEVLRVMTTEAKKAQEKVADV